MRQKIVAMGIVLGLVGAAGVFAADLPTPEDIDMKIEPAAVTLNVPGGTQNFEILLTTREDATQGWSLGVILEPQAGVTARFTKVANGPGTMTVKNGDPADYKKINLYQAADLTKPVTCTPLPCFPPDIIAFIQGVIIDNVDAIVTLPATENFSMLSTTVEIAGGDGQTCAMSFTDGVGQPATETIAVYDGQGVKPGVKAGATITLTAPVCVVPAAFTIDIQDGKAETNVDVQSVITLNFNADGSWPAETQIQGWSYGICVLDTAKLGVVSAGASVAGTDSATVYNGGPPGYNKINYFENGIVHAVIIDNVDSLVTIPTQNDWTDLMATFKILMIDGDPATYVVPCNEALGGTKKTANVMVIDGNSIKASAFEGTDPTDPDTGCCDPTKCNKPGKFEFYEVPGATFVPGNANGDKRLDIADGIYILNNLFRSGPPLPCQKAGDANGDCAVDSADALYIIYYYLQPAPGGYPAPVWGLGCQLILGEVCENLTCDTPEACP